MKSSNSRRRRHQPPQSLPSVADLRSLLNAVRTSKPQPPPPPAVAEPEPPVAIPPERARATDRLSRLDVHINATKLPILMIEIRGGHVANREQFVAEVIQPAMHRLADNHGMKIRLVIDLRRLLMVTQKTAYDILDEVSPWIGRRVERVCVVLPRAETNRNALVQAYSTWVNETGTRRTLVPVARAVNRARDVREFIEADEEPPPRLPFSPPPQW